MSETAKPTWERFGDLMLAWCGYVLLALASVIVFSAGDTDPVWRLETFGLAAVAAAWIYVFYTRCPEPVRDHRLRMRVFFAGLLVLAAALMLRHPLFFIFMISGFFYATLVRPLPLAVVGVAATSLLINSLIAG